jgi:hypothetical protein
MIKLTSLMVDLLITNGAEIKAVWTSNKLTVLETDTFNSSNTDSDTLYENIVNYSKELDEEFNNVSCMLVIDEKQEDEKQYAEILPE